MQLIFTLLLLMLSLGSSLAQINLKNLEKYKFPNGDYVRVKEWSEAGKLRAVWTKKDEEIQITGNGHVFQLTVDSRKARLNGLNFMLSLPVLNKNGLPYVSLADAQYLFSPLFLNPPRNAPGDKIRTIMLDAGHGGRDPGNMEKRTQEKRLALSLTEDLARLLKQSGYRILLTRSSDRFVDLSERAAAANKAQADLFVSLHFNSAASREVSGIEIYSLTPQGTASSNDGTLRGENTVYAGNNENEKNLFLAWHIQKSVQRNLSVEDRGLKRARFEVLRNVKMPAVLIEAGFMSNPAEGRKISDSKYRRQMALAIAEGIRSYQKAVEVPEPEKKTVQK